MPFNEIKVEKGTQPLVTNLLWDINAETQQLVSQCTNLAEEINAKIGRIYYEDAPEYLEEIMEEPTDFVSHLRITKHRLSRLRVFLDEINCKFGGLV